MLNQIKSLGETDLSSVQLMEIEADVLFTSDENGRLLRVNEPWPDSARAARMLLTLPQNGPARCYFREDLPDELIREIEKIAGREEPAQTLTSPPNYQKEYVRLLGGGKVEYGPCYWMPDLPVEADIVFLSEQNVRSFIQNGFSWLAEDLPYSAPSAAVIAEKPPGDRSRSGNAAGSSGPGICGTGRRSMGTGGAAIGKNPALQHLLGQPCLSAGGAEAWPALVWRQL